mmetsp:Transcript_135659/g.351699  ORF Transcript_135659/g.351699 Transcript_135659/m.351699 type:complete len:186 (+) Transcript_135659:239-796(+)
MADAPGGGAAGSGGGSERTPLLQKKQQPDARAGGGDPLGLNRTADEIRPRLPKNGDNSSSASGGSSNQADDEGAGGAPERLPSWRREPRGRATGVVWANWVCWCLAIVAILIVAILLWRYWVAVSPERGNEVSKVSPAASAMLLEAPGAAAPQSARHASALHPEDPPLPPERGGAHGPARRGSPR